MRWPLRFVNEAECFPRGYGPAYPRELGYVAAPLGLHWVIAAWHRFNYWMMASAAELGTTDYDRGYRAGQADANREHARQFMTRRNCP